MANPAEVLRRPLFAGLSSVDAGSASNQMAGFVTVNSGSATATVSTQAVKSHSLILMTVVNQNSGIAASSAFWPGMEVKSIVHGAYFTIGWSGGSAQARQARVHWFIFDTA